jgi:hypothetical protein
MFGDCEAKLLSENGQFAQMLDRNVGGKFAGILNHSTTRFVDKYFYFNNISIHAEQIEQMMAIHHLVVYSIYHGHATYTPCQVQSSYNGRVLLNWMLLNLLLISIVGILQQWFAVFGAGKQWPWYME